MATLRIVLSRLISSRDTQSTARIAQRRPVPLSTTPGELASATRLVTAARQSRGKSPAIWARPQRSDTTADAQSGRAATVRALGAGPTGDAHKDAAGSVRGGP